MQKKRGEGGREEMQKTREGGGEYLQKGEERREEMQKGWRDDSRCIRERTGRGA